jgi:hypothetical protein
MLLNCSTLFLYKIEGRTLKKLEKESDKLWLITANRESNYLNRLCSAAIIQ